MTIAGSEFNLPPWMDESLSPQAIPLERDKPEYPPRFGHISEQSVQNLFFPDGRPTLGAVGRSPEELEEIRLGYIYSGDISPERTDSPEVWARWYKVMEEKRALDSEKGGADAGRQSSDVSDLPVAGAQYAMMPPGERGNPRPGRISTEIQGGGVSVRGSDTPTIPKRPANENRESKQINPTPYEDALINQSFQRLGKQEPFGKGNVPDKLSAKVDRYDLYDLLEKKVIGTYKSTPAQRRRARSVAERKNLEYGAHRYIARPVYTEE